MFLITLQFHDIQMDIYVIFNFKFFIDDTIPYKHIKT